MFYCNNPGMIFVFINYHANCEIISSIKRFTGECIVFVCKILRLVTMLAKNVLKVSAISLSSVIILSFPTNVILLDHNITLLFSVILFFTCFSMFQVPILQSTSCHNRPRYFFIYKKQMTILQIILLLLCMLTLHTLLKISKNSSLDCRFLLEVFIFPIMNNFWSQFLKNSFLYS